MMCILPKTDTLQNIIKIIRHASKKLNFDPKSWRKITRNTRAHINSSSLILTRMSSIRGVAFQILNNKVEIAKTREKTQICKYVLDGKKCYKKGCTYAHKKDELRAKTCLFGDQCGYITSKAGPCLFVHPRDATPELYKIRTGENWPLDEVKIPPPKPKGPKLCQYVAMGKTCRLPSCPMLHSKEEVEATHCTVQSLAIAKDQLAHRLETERVRIEMMKDEVIVAMLNKLSIASETDDESDDESETTIILNSPSLPQTP